MKFADRLQNSIERSKSVICAGFDPQLESFPKFILDAASAKGQNTEECVYHALTSFYSLALEAISNSIAAVKPNIAFFEQYGLGGIRAFSSVCALCKELGLPVIADAKRGDIGSTAKAYSAAYLGQSAAFGKTFSAFNVDAITVNPFLGFDTVAPFLEDAAAYDKGIFVLVKTSNPGSSDIQGIKSSASQKSISESVAHWISDKCRTLMGKCGYSGLGAVVGATYPDEARALRKIMPASFFLIPGFGAQGASAKDAKAGFSENGGGAVINVSRGIFALNNPDFPDQALFKQLLFKKVSEVQALISSP